MVNLVALSWEIICFSAPAYGISCKKLPTLKNGAQGFAYPIRNPSQYGMVEFDETGEALSLEEKPEHPRSRYAVPGLCFYDGQAAKIAAQVLPSSRGEFEITDVNRTYLERGELTVRQLGRGIAWLDAGTPEMLLQAANFVQAVEERQGLMIRCPEEVAYRMGFISRDELRTLADNLLQTSYGEYLLQLLELELSLVVTSQKIQATATT